MVQTATLLMGLLMLSNSVSAGEVKRIEYRNPVAGFAMTIPEDWAVATAIAGNVELAIDAPTGATLIAHPAIEFFYSSADPETTARQLGALLQAGVAATSLRITATGKLNEWELTATFPVSALGPIQSRWLCRKDRGVTYVTGALYRSHYEALFKEDIDRALATCHLIDRPILRLFLDPTEHAYRLMLPYGWSWVASEGRIIRSLNDPGSFAWKAQRNDRLAGCFISPAATLPGSVPYASAETAAGGLVLQELRKKISDLQVESIQPFSRASSYFAQLIKAANPTMNPRISKARVDYKGHLSGKEVRLRAIIVTLLNDQPVLPGIPPNPWSIYASGVWAPVDEFSATAAIAEGVQASFRLDPIWKKRSQEAVAAVLGYRGTVFDKANTDWDQYIRHTRPVKDPISGKEREIPDGPGQAYLDPGGEVQFVGPGQTAATDWKEMEPVR